MDGIRCHRYLSLKKKCSNHSLTRVFVSLRIPFSNFSFTKFCSWHPQRDEVSELLGAAATVRSYVRFVPAVYSGGLP